MRKFLLIHISSSGCCNPLVTMLNNGDFGFPYCATPAFSTPAVWCRVFQSRVFSRPKYIPDEQNEILMSRLSTVIVSHTYIHIRTYTTEITLCLKKHLRHFLALTQKNIVRFSYYWAHVLPRK